MSYPLTNFPPRYSKKFKGTAKSKIGVDFIPPMNVMMPVFNPMKNQSEVRKGFMKAGLLGDTPLPNCFNWYDKELVAKTKYYNQIPASEVPDMVTPMNQGNCGSCYSCSTVTAIEDRFNIWQPKQETPELSIKQGITCNPDAGAVPGAANMGCSGGFPLLVGIYAEQKGILPVSIDPDALSYDENVGSCSAIDRLRTNNTGALYKCVPGSTHSVGSYVTNLTIDPDGENEPLKQSIDAIRAEIFANGPVTVGMKVYSDFMRPTNPKAVYRANTRGEMLGLHAVDLVGWTIPNPNDPLRTGYWWLRNSWGPDWCDGGFIRFGFGQCCVDYFSNEFDSMSKGYLKQLMAVNPKAFASRELIFGGAVATQPNITRFIPQRIRQLLHAYSSTPWGLTFMGKQRFKLGVDKCATEITPTPQPTPPPPSPPTPADNNDTNSADVVVADNDDTIDVPTNRDDEKLVNGGDDDTEDSGQTGGDTDESRRDIIDWIRRRKKKFRRQLTMYVSIAAAILLILIILVIVLVSLPKKD